MNKLKVLVLGANGMLGGSIHRYLTASESFQVLGTVREEKTKSKLNELGFSNIEANIDVRESSKLSQVFEEFSPNVVINCVGVIKQIEQSKDPILSIELNSLLPHRLAKLCTQYNAKLVHFSTDCVFSGERGGYVEEDIPDETNIYGRSKLLGEVDYGSHLTLRTSIIGHELQGHVSLVDWFLSQKNQVKGFSRAIFSGFPTIVVAEILAVILKDYFTLSGLYHLSSEAINKFNLLSLISKVYDFDISIVEDIALNVDKSLNSNKLKLDVPSLKIDDWPTLVRKMHNEYMQYFYRNG